MMNTDIKKDWIAALRSGDYEQGVTCLRDRDNRFCCLGVLCDLHAKAHPEYAWSGPTTVQSMGRGYIGATGTLPNMVMFWSELRDSDPRIAGIRASHWNDVKESSFLQIADMIENDPDL